MKNMQFCVTLIRVFKVFCYFLQEKIRIFSAHIVCVMGSIGSDQCQAWCVYVSLGQIPLHYCIFKAHFVNFIFGGANIFVLIYFVVTIGKKRNSHAYSIFELLQQQKSKQKFGISYLVISHQLMQRKKQFEFEQLINISRKTKVHYQIRNASLQTT